jgi:hypothetical protein
LAAKEAQADVAEVEKRDKKNSLSKYETEQLQQITEGNDKKQRKDKMLEPSN